MRFMSGVLSKKGEAIISQGQTAFFRVHFRLTKPAFRAANAFRLGLKGNPAEGPRDKKQDSDGIGEEEDAPEHARGKGHRPVLFAAGFFRKEKGQHQQEAGQKRLPTRVDGSVERKRSEGGGGDSRQNAEMKAMREQREETELERKERDIGGPEN